MSGLRVLGVDTALRSTGVGIVEAAGGRFTALEFGALAFSPRRPVSACLGGLHAGVADLIRRWEPGAVAIEGVFFCRNTKTAVTLGEARGAVIAAAAGAQVPVFEYAPRSVKQALVGFGGAEKVQVRRMVMSMLGLQAEPQEDAGDALAIAICHLNRRSGHEALAPSEL